MENASKALIIAGAILLSILIIGIGMAVFNAAQGTMNRVNLDETERLTFNQKYTQYEGPKVKGSTVQALISMMIASNEDENLPKVELEVDGVANTTWGAYRGTIKSAGIYKVELEYTSGVVSKVKITSPT